MSALRLHNETLTRTPEHFRGWLVRQPPDAIVGCKDERGGSFTTCPIANWLRSWFHPTVHVDFDTVTIRASAYHYFDATKWMRDFIVTADDCLPLTAADCLRILDSIPEEARHAR